MQLIQFNIHIYTAGYLQKLLISRVRTFTGAGKQ